jgi:hypothetical protein
MRQFNEDLIAEAASPYMPVPPGTCRVLPIIDQFPQR